MEDYLNKGKEIVKILINNGFEAYFIGEVVRNKALERPITEIEINTSATPDAIRGIFDFTKVEEYSEGVIKVMYHSYVFFISTFRLEEYKDKRTPVKIHYSKNLLDDLSSRDFTINAFAMSHSGKITDAYNGFDDMRKRRIRMIGKPRVRFAEDPLRTLRAIRLVSELKFKLQPNVRSAIRGKAKRLKEVAPRYLASELKKLVEGEHYKRALDLVINLGVAKNLGPFNKVFKLQNKRFKKLSFEEFLLAAFVLQAAIDEEYLEFVEHPAVFNKAFQLVLANPKANYTRADLFYNGEEVCLLANKISYFIGKSKKKYKKITAEYEELVIKQMSDLTFRREDVLRLANNLEGDHIQTVVDQMVEKVLAKELNNDFDVLKVFAINRLREMNIDITTENIVYDYRPEEAPKQEEKPEIAFENYEELDKNLEYKTLVNAKSEDEIADSLKRQGQIIKDYTEHRIDMLERRLNEQERIIREKDLKFQELERETRQRKIELEVETLVQKNLEQLKESNYLSHSHKDKIELSKQLHRVYMGFVSDMEDKYRSGAHNEED